MDAETGTMALLPIDHGATLGPIPGLRNIGALMKDLHDTPLNGVIMHKGIAAKCSGMLPSNAALILHLGCSVQSSPSVLRKTLVSTVDDALRIGADAISVHVNLSARDRAMLQDFGFVSSECYKWNIPLLAMMYYRNEDGEKNDVESVSLIARVAMEVGADIVKVSYTGDPGSFSEVVSSVDLPVVAAGGQTYDDISNFYRFVESIMAAGAAGVAVGRNCFQRVDRRNVLINVSEIVLGYLERRAASRTNAKIRENA